MIVGPEIVLAFVAAIMVVALVFFLITQTIMPAKSKEKQVDDIKRNLPGALPVG